MTDYVAQIVALQVAGQKITDFKSVSIGPRELRKQFRLMGKAGTCKTTPLHLITVDYVVPETGAFDWTTVANATLAITYVGGSKVTFNGVSVLEIGEAKADNENEIVMAIKLAAEKRDG